MNMMNTRPFLLAIVLLLQAARLVAEPPSARSLPSLMPAPEFALRHASEIGLTAGQQAKIESEVRELETAARKLSEQVRHESDALAQLLAHDAPDEAAVAAQFEKVLAAEDEVKRVRLKMSLRTRAVLTAEQQHKLASLQNADTPRRIASAEQQALAAKMERVKELIESAKAEGRDLVPVREMWKRVGQLTLEGKTTEACRILDETAGVIESKLAAPLSEPARPSNSQPRR